MSLGYLYEVFTDLQKDLEFLRNSKNEDLCWAKHQSLKYKIQMLIDSIEFLQRIDEFANAKKAV